MGSSNAALAPRPGIAPRRRTRVGARAALVVLAGALALAGCGGHDAEQQHGEATGTTVQHAATATVPTQTSKGGLVDRAFVAQMVPHHEMAVAMAREAPSRAEHPELRELARSIATDQAREIATLRAAADRLGVPIAGMPAMGGDAGAHADHGAMEADAKTLGLAMDDMGMAMDGPDLATAKPFDRAFIDAMVPHHQGAIRMARAELARGQDAELERLARAIVTAQEREIRRMNAWRARWYGAASPAGGVPTA